jgi:hypothetical protein
MQPRQGPGAHLLAWSDGEPGDYGEPNPASRGYDRRWAVCHLQLREDVGHVVAHSLFAEGEPFGDGALAVARRYQVDPRLAHMMVPVVAQDQTILRRKLRPSNGIAASAGCLVRELSQARCSPDETFLSGWGRTITSIGSMRPRIATVRRSS